MGNCTIWAAWARARPLGRNLWTSPHKVQPIFGRVESPVNSRFVTTIGRGQPNIMKLILVIHVKFENAIEFNWLLWSIRNTNPTTLFVTKVQNKEKNGKNDEWIRKDADKFNEIKENQINNTFENIYRCFSFTDAIRTVSTLNCIVHRSKILQRMPPRARAHCGRYYGMSDRPRRYICPHTTLNYVLLHRNHLPRFLHLAALTRYKIKKISKQKQAAENSPGNLDFDAPKYHDLPKVIFVKNTFYWSNNLETRVSSNL